MTKVIYCCGKIYHELDKRRVDRDQRDVAILRIEQLYPFHNDLITKIDAQYPQGASRVWVQEEPYNSGAYLHVCDMFQEELGWDRPEYIGRPRSSTPATGSKAMHKIEQEEVISGAIGASPDGEKTKTQVAAAKA